MRAFAALCNALEAAAHAVRPSSDASRADEPRLPALEQYFAQARPGDAAWALHLLLDGGPRAIVPAAVLRQAAQQAAWQSAAVPDWLFALSLQTAGGDLADTVAQVLPPPAQPSALGLADWMNARLPPLRGATPENQIAALAGAWAMLGPDARFWLTKLVGGGFRPLCAPALLRQALARHSGLAPACLAQRLDSAAYRAAPTRAETWQALLVPEPVPANPGHELAQDGQPYPFAPIHPCPEEWQPREDGGTPRLPGPAADWQAEWAPDGLRAQLLHRAGQPYLWLPDDELVTARFPEVAALARHLPPNTALEGDLLRWPSGADKPASRALLQACLQRKAARKPGAAEGQTVFIASDLLELEGEDWRPRPAAQRRARLEALLSEGPFRCAPLWPGADGWALAALHGQARAAGMAGLLLSHRGAPHASVAAGNEAMATIPGRWCWPLPPLQLDTVLLYAQPDAAQRAGLLNEFTVALWNRPPHDAAEARAVLQTIARGEPAQPGGLHLVTLARARSALCAVELQQVDRDVRAHTLQKFGPVRSVLPQWVMRLGFDGLQPSRRHKSGVALQSARILRLRREKLPHQADSLQDLRLLMAADDAVSRSG